jgi:arylsulfatase A-like enzyme
MGPRGDGIVEMDWMTGEIMKTIQTLGIADNTIVIFSSDNGPVLDDGYADKALELNGNHTPTGVYKGGKYSAYEGGTRVPFIVSWPNKIKADETNA